ncbi:hypothetical protein G8V05_13965 [Clostridium botulinum C/D]|uniref:hypothetical protein n=1 Tax=Clostridium botulinum TaxID=1491 RepID=UPI000A5B387C|nr:hypothetical protein [Clostridium botulinum]MCD3231364.1 hypothetical protein [Clostridium botulinum C/D]MCD3255021.1 hypothetical protein [Clostridium botulinum C/D]MCD3277773.1 hypothetical protein [Clostridium botulinum C/D]MCD3283294.1 hypothetical protein [Clostridium botulinum C/D]MCD3340234.1 hypothetical protein [Clostridium botulinum C/D]
MTSIKYLIQLFPQLKRLDDFCLKNGMFSTFVVLFFIFKGIDYIKSKEKLKGIGLMLRPFIINYAVGFFI